ncbi:MAG: hypothetical protein J6Y46_08175 [Prevotella sp.]|nr:hypothetical protein [Prevotella sp.]
MKIKTSLLLIFILGLMSAHAQTRLTPISGAIFWGNGILTDYDTELNSLFLPSSFKFAYIVRPSFTPEYSLVGVNDSTLILRKAKQLIWSSINKHKKASIKEYQLQISPAIMDSISKLFEMAVLTSSYLDEVQGLDGITYNFIKGHYTAECWTPIAGTNCGRLVALADSICKAVEQKDSMLIKRNMNNISELYHTFKTLYNGKSIEDSNGN